ncbi:DMT family transporter [Bacillus horti]|uniref:Multidrug transporter EmrE-like cation transporter n=1 Tax=Caldalkalibacillus horti TaxID=77523 RepID=A0ABT9W568_9BACI|nr:multidrug efflux SMR transporter [Bacillus horti]MDQ0168397.1 multidrug transporter EmrE-like cation transporter [Bacillus horti]
MIMAYLFLGAAIIIEVFGSTMLKVSNGFTRLWPSLGVIIGFGAAFYLLSLALLELPLGFTYATWSGVGTILTVLVGLYFFREKINKQGVFGLMVLILGIILLNLEK